LLETISGGKSQGWQDRRWKRPVTAGPQIPMSHSLSLLSSALCQCWT